MENTKLETCKKCLGTGHVHGGDENSSWSKACEYCHGIGFVRVPMTNAERFRAMSDEEQQKFVRRFWEIEDFADWLKQPKEGDPTGEEARAVVLGKLAKECPRCGAKMIGGGDGEE